MNKENIDKIECLIGYLKYLQKEKWCLRCGFIIPQELPFIIEQAEVWVEELKQQILNKLNT